MSLHILILPRLEVVTPRDLLPAKNLIVPEVAAPLSESKFLDMEVLKVILTLE